MKHFKFLLLVGLALAGGWLPAQTPKPVERPPGRYLFIVETSSAMRRRAGSVQDAVQSLLRSDLNGQLREGDTLGLWTFNEELYAGQFPLQSWSPESREAVALAVAAFLKQQRYEKQTRFENVISGLERVINSSATLTVVLVSAGEMEIPGTLFGREINAAYAQWSREMERASMPFISVLRARNGQIVGRSVNMAPWPVTFPELPPEPAPAVAANLPHYVPLKEPLPAPAPKPRAPIILDMSEAAKAQARATDKTATPSTVQSTVTAPAPAGQGTAPAPVPAEPVSPTTEVQPPVAPPAAPAPTPIIKPAESLQVIAVMPGPSQSVAPAAQSPAAPTGTPKNEPPQPAPASPVVVTTPPPQAITPPAPAPPVPVAVPQTEPQVTTAPPAPAVETTRTPAAEPAAEQNQPAAIEAKPMSDSSPSGQAAVAVPPEMFFSGKRLIVAALILLTVLVGLLIMFLRRPRAAPHASLITRSMDRKED